MKVLRTEHTELCDILYEDEVGMFGDVYSSERVKVFWNKDYRNFILNIVKLVIEGLIIITLIIAAL